MHVVAHVTFQLWKCRCGVGLESPEVAHQWCDLRHYVPTFALDMWAFGLLLVALWGGNMPGSMISNCTQYLSNLVLADEQLLHKVRLVEPPRL